MKSYKKFYNSTAELRNQINSFLPVKVVGKRGEIVPETVKRLRDGMKLIDIGCGPGRIMLEIYKCTDKKVKMVGVDNSAAMIRIAKQNGRGIKDVSFELMDACDMRYRTGTFDIGLNRFGAPPESYGEAYRILKKGGLFLLYVGEGDDWKEIGEHMGFSKPRPAAAHLAALKAAGFKTVKKTRYHTVEYYRDMADIVKVLEIVPFKPPFDRKKHAKKLKEYEKKYKTPWGIKSSHNRILVISRK